MRNDFFNAKGYPDPTAYLAIKEMLYLPIVYICSPYRGDVETNVGRARTYSRFAVYKGAIPIAPHLLFPQFMDDDNVQERELAMKMNLILLDRCEEIWIFGDTLSQGMARELSRAKRKNKTIRNFTTDMEEIHP
ncbi:DUF7768 domain-containing protein [Savagea faecisuis]|uniref:DUF4406 domain-containing protein n=1 Tax=Savagea faecisuis TaxID=1274803 RepID=A0ABW3GUK6_9BACL